MAKIVINKIEEIYSTLKAENKFTKIEECKTHELNKEVNEEIRKFRQSLHKKEKESNQQAADIILNS